MLQQILSHGGSRDLTGQVPVQKDVSTLDTILQMFHLQKHQWAEDQMQIEDKPQG